MADEQQRRDAEPQSAMQGSMMQQMMEQWWSR